jgi:hypothetical protein
VSSNEFSEENTDYVGEPVMSGEDLLSETPDAEASEPAQQAAGGGEQDSSGSEQVGVEPSAPGPRTDEQIP